MLSSPAKTEIDHHTLKLVAGLIALTLGGLTDFLTGSTITSISASYWAGGWAQSIFIGFLFAIAAFLLAYNGRSRTEMVLSKVAAVAAAGVALYPCGCDGHQEVIPALHYISAAVMFVILIYFCCGFYHRARQKGHPEANLRATVYAVSAVVIAVASLAMLLDTFTGDAFSGSYPRFRFYCECAALSAFGVAWLTASRCLPGLTSSDERLSPLS